MAISYLRGQEVSSWPDHEAGCFSHPSLHIPAEPVVLSASESMMKLIPIPKESVIVWLHRVTRTEEKQGKSKRPFFPCLFIWAVTKIPPTFRVGLLVTIVAVKTIPTDVSTRQPVVHGPLLRRSYQITTPGCIKLLI